MQLSMVEVTVDVHGKKLMCGGGRGLAQYFISQPM